MPASGRSEEHTSELQSRSDLVCRLLLEKKKNEQGEAFWVLTSGQLLRLKLAGTAGHGLSPLSGLPVGPAQTPSQPLSRRPGRVDAPLRRHPPLRQHKMPVRSAFRPRFAVSLSARHSRTRQTCARPPRLLRGRVPFTVIRALRAVFFFFFNDPAPPEISPLPLPDPLPICPRPRPIYSRKGDTPAAIAPRAGPAAPAI